MKHIYYSLMTVLALYTYSSQAQNAFDRRSYKSPRTNPVFVQKTGRIDGSKNASMQAVTGRALPKANAVLYALDYRKPETKRRSIINSQHAIEEAYLFLYQSRELLAKGFDINQLSARESFSDALGYKHIRMQQVWKGIEVFGSELLVHFLENETYTHGNWTSIPEEFNCIPAIAAYEAVTTANGAFVPEYGWTELSPAVKKLMNYNNPESTLILLTENNSLSLVYEVMIRPNMLERWRIRVDAQSGKILETLNLSCHADGPRSSSGNDLNGVSRTVNSYQAGSSFYLIDASRNMFNPGGSSMPDDPSGAIWTIDAGNTYIKSFNQIVSGSANFSNPTAISAHYNAGFAYEYYRTVFNRNSINGSGGTIISVINVSDQNGQGFDNAFWNGSFMAYGNGKTLFKPLAGALDVAGHEMTHGVVEKSASLEYKDQSGAINESMADIFGCMMDRSDWKMGEDVMKPGVSSTGALRDLQNPHNGGTSFSDNFYQPAHMTEYYTGTQDNGGVHINSGIPNHAFYLFATALSKEKAEQVYYRALTVYLTKTSVFRDLRDAVIQASKDLYGNTEATAAADAFDAVGIYGEPVQGGGGIGDNVDDLNANPGADFILYYDVDPNVSFTLSKATLSNSSTAGQITRNVKRKASVLDDGSYAVYVGSDSRIYALQLDGSKTETIMSDETIWDNVAISKDGKRIAAITTQEDTSIYVYDFTKNEWKRFKLYNPTYSGVNSGGVLYADALEWDHTGTRIMYDARNVIDNQGGNDYSYWDVGVIEVWDAASNDWGGGKIEKLFSSLPDNVSIGNPVYSQKSPYIVAFDYIDAGTGQYYILNYNLNTNKAGTIFNGSDLGFPCFSRNDDKLIFNAFNTNSDEVVANIALNPDKISSSGNATILIGLAKWGVWYADGTRNLLFDKKDILSFAFNGLSPAVTAVINGSNISATVPQGTDLTSLVASFQNSAYSRAKKGSVMQTSGVNSNNFTNSVVYTVVAQDGSSKNYTVNVTVNAVSVGENTFAGFRVYPNPNNGILYIENAVEGATVTVFDTEGRSVSRGTVNDGIYSLSELESGIYMILVESEGRCEYVKLIKT